MNRPIINHVAEHTHDVCESYGGWLLPLPSHDELQYEGEHMVVVCLILGLLLIGIVKLEVPMW